MNGIGWRDRLWVARFDAVESGYRNWVYHFAIQLLRELRCKIRRHDTEVIDIEGADMVYCNTCWIPLEK